MFVLLGECLFSAPRGTLYFEGHSVVCPLYSQVGLTVSVPVLSPHDSSPRHLDIVGMAAQINEFYSQKNSVRW